MIYDIIVVGAGFAGMTSALYALRNEKKVLLLEREAIGGQIADSPKVENYPTVKEVSGLDLSNNLFEQITDLGCDFDLDNVLEVEKKDGLFNLKGEYSNYETKTVILATGSVHRKIGVDREDDLAGRGVSYCAVCDGPFFKGEDIVVIGDGNTALQYALTLSTYAKKITLATLTDKLFAEETIINRALNNDKITVINHVSLKKFIGDADLTGLEFENTKTKETFTIDCRACFIAIGLVPDNERYKNVIDLEKGYIVTDENQETRTPGLFGAGDCTIKKIRQLTTAVNDGTIAAINAINYLDSLKNN